MYGGDAILPWRPYGSAHDEMGLAETVPTVYVEAGQRRDAEAFASQLESLGAPADAPSEALEYARLDAAALLLRLAGTDKALLEDLQAALVSKDMAAFAAALESKKVGSRSLRSDLEAAARNGDKRALADALRRLALPALNNMMARSAGKPQMGMEVAGPHDPLMGTERRCAVDCYLTGKPICPKSFEMRRPPNQEYDPIVYATISLGYDAAQWEQDCAYHPFVHDAANAVSDLAVEAHGTGYLDGRLDGSRPFGVKY